MTDLNGFYELRTQSGVHVARPDATLLASCVSALAAPQNHYLTVQPHPDSDWYVLVTLPEPGNADPYDGIYQVRYQDDGDGEQWSAGHDDPAQIAQEVLRWVGSKLQQEQHE
jgi:hypothetical protein